jgi:hypothetical protein
MTFLIFALSQEEMMCSMVSPSVPQILYLSIIAIIITNYSKLKNSGISNKAANQKEIKKLNKSNALKS